MTPLLLSISLPAKYILTYLRSTNLQLQLVVPNLLPLINLSGNTVFPESDSESELYDQPPVDLYVEEGELSEDQDVIRTNPSLKNIHTGRL